MPSSRGIDEDGQRTSPVDSSGGGPPPEGGEFPVPEPPAGPAADAERDALADELARAEDRFKRALADLDNYRKRAAREADRRIAEVRESMLLDWLQAVDSVERAMQMEPDGPCQEGLGAVLAQMDGVLEREGARRIGAPGEAFDPARHEAVAVRTSDELPDHAVLEVHRSGIALGDRVIRPAQVVVARAGEPAR